MAKAVERWRSDAVNLQKLGKQLKRECVRSPKKAALLGIGLLVAGWFWAPLLQDWFGQKSTASSTTKKPTVAVATSANPTAPTTKSVSWDWQSLLASIQGDPQRKSAQTTFENRHPFGAAPPPLVVEDEPEEQPTEEPVAPEPAPKLEMTPAMLGLVLTGTLVGPHLKIATINGENYREHSRLAIRPNQQSGFDQEESSLPLAQSPLAGLTDLAGMAGLAQAANQSAAVPSAETGSAAEVHEFLLAQIHRKYVVLQREDGTSYRLDLKQTPSNRGRIVLRPAMATAQ